MKNISVNEKFTSAYRPSGNSKPLSEEQVKNLTNTIEKLLHDDPEVLKDVPGLEKAALGTWNKHQGF